jgi:hypothetical protein
MAFLVPTIMVRRRRPARSTISGSSSPASARQVPAARTRVTAPTVVTIEHAFDTLRGMIRHILILQQRPGATPEDIEGCRAGLAGLVGRMPGLVNFHWGQNIAPEERRAGFTHGFTMDFVDQASLDTYGPHPQHQVVAAKVREAFERIVVFDFAM